jgi:hypothetical protein
LSITFKADSGYTFMIIGFRALCCRRDIALW